MADSSSPAAAALRAESSRLALDQRWRMYLADCAVRRHLAKACWALLVLSMSGYAARTEAEPFSKESVPLLERMAAEHAANRDRIRTWRGTLDWSREVQARGSKAIEEREKGIVRFVYDRDKDWAFSRFEQTEVIAGGHKGVPRVYASMLTDEAYWSYNTYTPEHFPQKFVPVLSIGHPSEGREGRRNVFPGPVDFRPFVMMRAVAGADVVNLFQGYAKAVKEGVDLKQRTLSRQGERVTLRSQIGESVNEYVIDLEKGCSLLRFVSEGSEPTSAWTGEPQMVAGVWIPRLITSELTNGPQTTVVRMEWRDQVVNEPTPEDQFTLAKLGVRQGDYVVDRRTGAQYQVTDERLEPPLTPGIARRLTRTSAWPRVVLGVCAIVVLIVAYLLLRRPKRTPASR